MRRPGNINGVRALSSRKARQLGNYRFSQLADFGKGAFVPPPGPGAPGASSKEAWNAKTRTYYVQDPQCPQGEKMIDAPCQGDDCCDIIGPGMKDCDPPGTIYRDCDDDPDYRDLPSGTWPSCEAVRTDPRWKGVPSNIIMDYCNAAKLPERVEKKAAPQQQQQQQQAAAPANDAEKQKLEAELLDLELESQQASSPAPAIQPASATYTGGGGGGPGYIPLPRAKGRAPVTTASKIRALVAEHQTKKAMQRTTAPRPVIAPAAAPMMDLPPAAAPTKPGGGGIIAWLRSTLFGAPAAGSGLGSFGDNEPMSPAMKAALIAGVAYVAYKQFS